MIIPKSLYIKNFLSFEEERLIIENGVTTCIMGRNLTEDDQESNGSGKSALQAAIEYVYTGSASRKVVKKKLVKRGEDEATITHEAFNNIKNETLRIERIIPKKGSEKVAVYLFKDKEEFLTDPSKFQIDLPTTKDSNDWIIEYVGISKEDISNYFIPNEVNYTSFFNDSDTKKKELISRFSNADIIDPVFDKVKEDSDKKDSEIVAKEKELNKLEGRLDQLREDLESEKERDFESEKTSSIQNLQNKINSCQTEIDGNKNELEVIEHSLDHLKDNVIEGRKNTLKHLQNHYKTFLKSIPDFEEKYKELNDELEKINTKVTKSDKLETDTKLDITDIEKDISKMELVLGGKIECPKCHHEFNPKVEITIDKAKEKLKGYQEELVEVKADLEKIRKFQEKYEEQRKANRNKGAAITVQQSSYDQQSRRISRIVGLVADSVERFEQKITQYSKSLQLLKDSDTHNSTLIKNYNNQIKELKKSVKDTTKQEALEKSIGEINDQIEDLNNEITKLSNEQESIKEWIVNFTQFKTYLANKKLKVIQDLVNKYLKDMKSSYRLKLEGSKVLSNGKDTRQKITPYIFHDGEMCEYGEFSKGERARIDFATLLTLQSLVNDTSPSGGLDLLWSDEIAEGVDSMGLGNLLESFNLTGRTSYITTHVVNENIYEHILMLEKVNGITNIVN